MTAFLKRPFFAGPACRLLLLLIVASGCSGDKTKKPEPSPPVPVKAAAAVQKTVPIQIAAIGNVEAYSSVAVKVQVGGLLFRVHFREGQEVNKGEVLFTIDPRPYEAALRQAEANLARDKAQLENARQEAARYKELANKGYVAVSQYDEVRTNFEALAAVVNADRAAVDNARLQLDYCVINAPITGQTGDIITREGNLIKANADTAMVVINRIQPIYVGFSVPEKDLPEIKKQMAARKLKIEAYVAGRNKDVALGELTFVDNTVETGTGTIKLKGTFANREKFLWPGQFVNVVLIIAEQENALVVPTGALQVGQQGQYVFVIKEDRTVDMRSVAVSRTFADESVLENGLEPGERVVTDGQLRLIPGAKVEIITEAGGGQR